MSMAANPTSLYLHIPFCARKCHYCDFPSYAGREEDIDAYFQVLTAEIQQAGRWSLAQTESEPAQLAPIETIYTGGGTPTLAGARRLARLLETVTAWFPLAPDAEISLEANPGTVTAADFACLRQAGFNRVSFGLQAWQPRLLRRLGRIHDAADFVHAVHAARAAGFDNISADIMLGLPGQRLGDVRETLNRVTALGVEHISFYSLQIEAGTPFDTWYQAGSLDVPGEEQEREMYHETRRSLLAQGYEPYEISSAALPGRACRHNLMYWQAGMYWGFGCAAHSHWDGRRLANPADLDAYMGAIAAGGPAPLPAAQVLETLDRDAQMREAMMLALRTTAGVDAAAFARRFGERPEPRFAAELADLAAQGWIAQTHCGWTLTARGLDFANQVFMAFV